MAVPLLQRRIERHVRYLPILEASPPNLIRSLKEQSLEGLVAKRRVSKYEPGRSATWAKIRVNHFRRPALQCPDLRV
jgi:ATP-dependent DNA ligase